MLVTGEPITFEWLLIVPALLLQAVFNAGLALLMARLGSQDTDLKQVMPFVMRTWMYASGVLYSVTLFRTHLPGWAATAAGVQPAAGLHRAGPLLAAGVGAAAPPAAAALAARRRLGDRHGLGGFIYFWRGEEEYGRG